MQKGDHLISKRIGYTHHGIYIGSNNVIHYSGASLGHFDAGVIEIVDLETFCQGNGYTIRIYPCRVYGREQSIMRAESRLGEDWYHLLLNNCEHFVTWCILGLPQSQQVKKMILPSLLGTLIGITALQWVKRHR